MWKSQYIHAKRCQNKFVFFTQCYFRIENGQGVQNLTSKNVSWCNNINKEMSLRRTHDKPITAKVI